MVTGGHGSVSGAVRRVVVAVAFVAAVAGCQPGTDPAAAARMHDQAKAVLARWADAVAAAGGKAGVVPVGDLTGQIGDWEPAIGDNNKRALMAGLVLTDSELSSATPSDGQVVFADGTSVTVPVLSAQDALVDIGRSVVREGGADPCGDCSPLMVASAKLGSGPVGTTRGDVSGPVWTFTIRGTGVEVTRVAIGRAVTVPPMSEAGGSAIGMRIDAATGSVSGTALTVSFTGAPLAGDQPCGEDYSAEAVESDLAVTVIVTRHPFAGPMLGGCTSVGALRTATAALAAPLGDRTVLDLQGGQPVTMTLTR